MSTPEARYLRDELDKMKDMTLESLDREHKHLLLIEKLVQELDSNGLLIIFLMKYPLVAAWLHNAVNLDKYDIPKSLREKQ